MCKKPLFLQRLFYKKSGSRSPSAETRWRTCEEAFAAAAGPKRREALATGARHRKLGAGFYTFLNFYKKPSEMPEGFLFGIFYEEIFLLAPADNRELSFNPVIFCNHAV
jgi:hypothetical protein